MFYTELRSAELKLKSQKQNNKGMKYCYIPTRSLLGPTSIAFQEKEYFEGQFVNPS